MIAIRIGALLAIFFMIIDSYGTLLKPFRNTVIKALAQILV
jgi:hypothetical protein